MANHWNDLFLRTDVRETDPETRYGGLRSPDIIPWGTAPVDPSQFTTDASYQQYYNNSLYQDTANYIYVRSKNSSVWVAKYGEVYLVMSNSADIIWPGGEGWTRIKTIKGNYASPIEDVAPGKIGVTTDPFQVTPKESGQRCLVSWISTPDHLIRDLPPKITDQGQIAEFLIEHPNYAHHNIDIIPKISLRPT